VTAELHCLIPLDRIGAQGLEVVVEANAAERAGLARRMGIPDVQSLVCRFRVTPTGADRFAAIGHLSAQVVQTCVISLDDFSAAIDEHFRLRFVPAGEETDTIDPEDPVDEIGYQDGVLDVGEAAAEQLGLALDPYPRRPGATLPEHDAEPPPPHPFDALRRH
jgi:uncharacterized metal-binding protein YceD (DUF177 family)